MDIHESPVTRLNYYSECPVDLIAALTLVGRTQRLQGPRLSDKVLKNFLTSFLNV